MGKVCTGCSEWRKSEEFHASSKASDGLHTRCKQCRATATLISKYNVSDAWLQTVYEEQDGLCAICGDEGPFLVVDHDHSCCPGATSCGLCVRALICQSCNTGLGNFHDNPDILTRAVEYLDLHKPWEGGV